MTCVICQRRPVERAQACEPCRLWLPAVLRDIGDSYQMLTEQEPPGAGQLAIEDDGTFDAPSVRQLHPLSAGPIRAAGASSRVSGSREAPVPVRLDLVDLTAPARLPNPMRGPGYYPRSLWPEDQIGHQPIATRLDLWARDWITHQRCPGDHLPDPAVPALITWLSVRCGWACDEHPAVDEFAAEMRDLRTVLSAANDDGPVYPEPILAVPCSGCDTLALFRPVKSPYRAECGGCGKLYTDDEYARWTGLVASWAKGST